MTADQLRMARALGSVTFPVASFQKRFGRDMAALAEGSPEQDLTEKQAAWLRWLVHRFRRQIPADVAALAGDAPPKPGAEERQRDLVAEHNARLQEARLVTALPAPTLFGNLTA